MGAAADLMSINNSNANAALSNANSALSAAQTAMNAIVWDDFTDPNSFEPPEPPPKYEESVEKPNTNVKAYEAPPAPEECPEVQKIDAIDVKDPVPFTDTMTPVEYVNRPSQLEPFNVPAPSVSLSQYKLPPDFTMLDPPAPLIQEHSIGGAPVVQPAVFDASSPEFGHAEPTDRTEALYRSFSHTFVQQVDGYIDAMLEKYSPGYRDKLAAIESRLTRYLDGGTGLNPVVEDAIYSRARSKNDAEARRVRDTAYSEAASRGFTLPPGALMSAIIGARQAAADNNAKAAAEIVVQQAELEQKNLQFALTQSIEFRKFMGQFTLSYMQNVITLNGQAVELAKSIQASLIEIYNAAVRIYTAKLEGYKAEAQAYEARLRSSMAALEVYKAELQALELRTNADKAKVDLFRSRVEAERFKAEAYKARADAIVAHANLQKLHIEIYQAQVQAHSARVQAYSAEWAGYEAEMKGELIKVEEFKAKAAGYEASARAFAAVASAKAEHARAQGMSADAQYKAYAARQSSYSEEVKGAIAAQQGDIARAQGEVERYKVEVTGAIQQYQADIELYKADTQTRLKDDELKATTNLHKATGKMQTLKAVSDAATAIGQVYANMAAGAMSGNNSLAAVVEEYAPI